MCTVCVIRNNIALRKIGEMTKLFKCITKNENKSQLFGKDRQCLIGSIIERKRRI